MHGSAMLKCVCCGALPQPLITAGVAKLVQICCSSLARMAHLPLPLRQFLAFVDARPPSTFIPGTLTGSLLLNSCLSPALLSQHDDRAATTDAMCVVWGLAPAIHAVNKLSS